MKNARRKTIGIGAIHINLNGDEGCVCVGMDEGVCTEVGYPYCSLNMKTQLSSHIIRLFGVWCLLSTSSGSFFFIVDIVVILLVVLLLLHSFYHCLACQAPLP